MQCQLHAEILSPRPPYQGLSLLFADLDRVEYSREVDNYDAWRALLTAEMRVIRCEENAAKVWCPRDRKLEGEPWLPSFCVDGQRLQRPSARLLCNAERSNLKYSVRAQPSSNSCLCEPGGNPARFVNAARMANQCDETRLPNTERAKHIESTNFPSLACINYGVSRSFCCFQDVNLEICELGRVAYFRTLRPVFAGPSEWKLAANSWLFNDADGNRKPFLATRGITRDLRLGHVVPAAVIFRHGADR